MSAAKSQQARHKARGFPSDAEVRSALAESGMRGLAIERAMSQFLRPLRLDFFGRRKRRLHDLVLGRLGMAQLREILAGIVTRHQRETGSPVSVGDLFQGNYQEMLVDYGATAVDRALNELARERIVRREKRGIVDVIRPTGKPYHPKSLVGLREVLERMKLDLHVRYATGYSTGRTYRM